MLTNIFFKNENQRKLTASSISSGTSKKSIATVLDKDGVVGQLEKLNNNEYLSGEYIHNIKTIISQIKKSDHSSIIGALLQCLITKDINSTLKINILELLARIDRLSTKPEQIESIAKALVTANLENMDVNKTRDFILPLFMFLHAASTNNNSDKIFAYLRFLLEKNDDFKLSREQVNAILKAIVEFSNFLNSLLPYQGSSICRTSANRLSILPKLENPASLASLFDRSIDRKGFIDYLSDILTSEKENMTTLLNEFSEPMSLATYWGIIRVFIALHHKGILKESNLKKVCKIPQYANTVADSLWESEFELDINITQKRFAKVIEHLLAVKKFQDKGDLLFELELIENEKAEKKEDKEVLVCNKKLDKNGIRFPKELCDLTLSFIAAPDGTECIIDEKTKEGEIAKPLR